MLSLLTKLLAPSTNHLHKTLKIVELVAFHLRNINLTRLIISAAFTATEILKWVILTFVLSHYFQISFLAREKDEQTS